MRGIVLHDQTSPPGFKWAQVWTRSEEEVQKCLGLQEVLAESRMYVYDLQNFLLSDTHKFSFRTVTRPPGLVHPAPATTLPLVPLSARPPTPNSSPFLGRDNPFKGDLPATPPSLFIPGVRPHPTSVGYRHMDPQGPLPRNLYVIGLPLDMTQ